MPTTSSAPTTVAPAPRQTAARRIRPQSQYWDFRTATWQTGSTIPVPRRGQ